MSEPMMSREALNWLKSIGYSKMNHEDRMAVIKAAKIAYPPTEEELNEDSAMDAFERLLSFGKAL